MCDVVNVKKLISILAKNKLIYINSVYETKFRVSFMLYFIDKGFRQENLKPIFSLVIGCFRSEPNKLSTLIFLDLLLFFVHKYGAVFFFFNLTLKGLI